MFGITSTSFKLASESEHIRLKQCCTEITPENIPPYEALSKLGVKEVRTYMQHLAIGLLNSLQKIQLEMQTSPRNADIKAETPKNKVILTNYQTKKENLFKNATYLLAVLLKFAEINKPTKEEIATAMAAFKGKSSHRLTVQNHMSGERLLFDWIKFLENAPEALSIDDAMAIFANAEKLGKGKDPKVLYGFRIFSPTNKVASTRRFSFTSAKPDSVTPHGSNIVNHVFSPANKPH